MHKILFIIVILIPSYAFSNSSDIKDNDRCIKHNENIICLNDISAGSEYKYKSVIYPWGYTNAPKFSYVKINYSKHFGSTSCQLIGISENRGTISINGFIFDCERPSHSKKTDDPKSEIEKYFEDNYTNIVKKSRIITDNPMEETNSFMGNKWDMNF